MVTRQVRTRVTVAGVRAQPTKRVRGVRVEPSVHIGLSDRWTLGLSPVADSLSERRRWDLNPRLVAQHTISSRADSAALALLRDCSQVRLTVAPGTNCPYRSVQGPGATPGAVFWTFGALRRPHFELRLRGSMGLSTAPRKQESGKRCLTDARRRLCSDGFWWRSTGPKTPGLPSSSSVTGLATSTRRSGSSNWRTSRRGVDASSSRTYNDEVARWRTSSRSAGPREGRATSGS